MASASTVCSSWICIIALALIFDEVSSLTHNIEGFIKTVMDCQNVPGLGLSVVMKNESFSRGFGFADISTGRKVDDETLFGIGSITKSFTVALLADLLTDDRQGARSCDWNIKLKDIIDDFESTDPIRTSEMSLKDVLSHRTGLENVDLGVLAGYPPGISRKNLTRKLKHLEEKFPFRDQFHYNNMMYMLAGYVAEVMGQDSWEHLISEKVFKKYGMVLSGFIHLNKQKNTAVPYIYDAENNRYHDVSSIISLHPVGPAGDILTNSKDMTLWLSHLLDMKTHDSCYASAFNPIIPALDSISYLKKYLYTAPEFDYQTYGYGMGWYVSTYKGYRLFSHSGSLNGYSAITVVLPELHTALNVNINAPRVIPIIIAFYIIDTFVLHSTPWVNETTACMQTLSVSSTLAVDGHKNNITNPWRYTGIFGHPVIGDLKITYSKEMDILKCQLGLLLRGVLYKRFEFNQFVVSVDVPLSYVYQFGEGQIILSFTNQSINTRGIFKQVDFRFGSSLFKFKKHPNLLKESNMSPCWNGNISLSIFIFISICNKIM